MDQQQQQQQQQQPPAPAMQQQPQQPPAPAMQQQPPAPAMQQQPQQPPAPAMRQPVQAQSGQNAYQAIIEQQQAQIAALIAQTNAQSEQITQLVQGGAQLQAQPPMQQATQQGIQNAQYPNVYQPFDAQAAPNANWQPPSMLDADYSLESLASEIGKPEGE